MAARPSELPAHISALEQRGIRYGLASYVDLHGRPKCKAVPIAHFEQMLRGSELFTGAALDGVPQEVNDDEVAAHPDFARAIVMPWKPDTMWLPSDLWIKDEPFEACSRQILKRALGRAAAMGFTFNLGIETEFFLFRPTESGGFEPALKPDFLEKPAYDVRLLLNTAPVVEELVAAMNGLGWDVYSFDQEDAPGQFETDFAYADALTMADRFTFFRLMAGQIAAKHGMFASFMPKPLANRTGSGAHYNMSLASPKSGDNLFIAKDDPRGCGLSRLGYQFIAGILRHAKAICAVIAPTVNSYKRLIAQGSMSGFTWAPIFICYGNNNRTNMLRIPMAGGRVECRAADIACNLYLGAAMILSAGLEGISEDLDPGEPNTDNMYLVAPEEQRRRGIERLPQTLAEAVAAFEADPLSRAVMGDKMFTAFAAYKKEEWRRYHTHVSDWELKEYLRFF
jgi:glutamine synthetase